MACLLPCSEPRSNATQYAESQASPLISFLRPAVKTHNNQQQDLRPILPLSSHTHPPGYYTLDRALESQPLRARQQSSLGTWFQCSRFDTTASRPPSLSHLVNEVDTRFYLLSCAGACRPACSSFAGNGSLCRPRRPLACLPAVRLQLTQGLPVLLATASSSALLSSLSYPPSLESEKKGNKHTKKIKK